MKLYDHQQKIIDEDSKKCGLFLGTGSGKTRIALLLAEGNTLVIAPKTQVEDKNWERESINLMRRSRFRALTVVSKETFRRDWEKLGKFDTVIVDEAHTCLGVTPNQRYRKRQPIPKASLLFEALASFLEQNQPKRLYLCTATIVKSPMTVWAAYCLLKPLRGASIYKNWFDFREKYYVQLPMPGRTVYAPKRDKATKESLARLVRSLGYVGRLEDYFDVPAQTFRTVHVELTDAQLNRIDSLRLEYPDPLVFIGKRHQVENGVLSGDEFNQAEIFDNQKIEKLLELAEEFPRLVIFAKYRAQIDQIDEAFSKQNYRTAILTGSTQDRGGLIAYANKQTDCIFICQAQISAGWELPAYPVMVFASRTYSYVDYVQALGRVQRVNNIKKNLYINLVVRDGIDEAVDKSLANKQDFDEKLYAEKLNEQLS